VSQTIRRCNELQSSVPARPVLKRHWRSYGDDPLPTIAEAPVLQIGADIYCDSQLIMRELERRHPNSSFHPAGRGAADALPEEFLEDRARFSGRNIDPAAMMAAVPGPPLPA
jgi:hypothetical protein